MPVQYDSKKIIPAPFVSVEKNYGRTGDSHKVGSKFILTVKGSLTCGGSPNSIGQFYTGAGYPPASFQDNVETLTTPDQRQKWLQNKAEALRYLFSIDGKSFEVQPWDGSAPMKCYPTVQSINFADGQWFNTLEYTIVLEANELFGINTAYMNDAEDAARGEDFFKDANGIKLYLQEVDENWQLELLDTEPESETFPYTFRLTHNVSAVGKRTYDDNGLVSDGWQQAKRWVIPRLGIDYTFINTSGSFGTATVSGLFGFDHVRQEATNELAGSYSVSETWLLARTNVREDFTVTTQTSIENGLTAVNVEGEIIGLDTRSQSNYNLTQTRYQAANDKFNSLSTGSPSTFYLRAQNYASSGVSLNLVALGSSVGRNPLTGRITYTFQYDNRPSTCVSGALTESIVISDKNPTDVFANIPVIGKTNGPVLQDMNTKTEATRTVAIEVGVTPVGICPTTAAGVTNLMNASPGSQVDTIINAFDSDLRSRYNQVFKSEDNPSWSPKNGRYSRTVSWTFQTCN